MIAVSHGEDIRACADRVAAEFAEISSPAARTHHLLEKGRDYEGLPVADQSSDNFIHGCQSQLWIAGAREGNVIRLRAHSDSLLMRGLLSILVGLYDRRRPDEILAHIDHADDELLLALAPSRAGGLAAVRRRIRELAQAMA
jgi:cysteine desulfuration protein SufE